MDAKETPYRFRGRETGFGAAVVHLLQSGHPTPTRSRSSLKDHDPNALEKGHTELIGVHPGRKRFIWWYVLLLWLLEIREYVEVVP
jgi:hypothetical protein